MKIVEDGVAILPDRTSFGGSVATFDRLVRTMAAAIGDDPVALAQMASTTPARLLGLADRGEIAPGKRAEKLAHTVKEKTGKDIYKTTDYKDLLMRRAIDALVICTAWESHIEIAVASMRVSNFVVFTTKSS